MASGSPKTRGRSRGGSSSAARGRRGGGGSAGKMSDKKLASSISATRAKMNEAGERMNSAARKLEEAQTVSRDKRAAAIASARKEYNAASNKFNSARDRLKTLETEQASRRSETQSTTSRPRVNSYGEATRRNITNSTYERAQRRQERQVAAMLGSTRGNQPVYKRDANGRTATVNVDYSDIYGDIPF